jgi:hypothetical protein
MGSPARLEGYAPALRQANLDRLESLAGALARHGLAAALVAPPGRVPRLRVTHPAGTAEDVYAWHCRDGTWWFWWPWAERIASAADLGSAAKAIEHVLAAPSSS